MKITFCFDRHKPLADASEGVAPDEYIDTYKAALLAAFRQRFPEHEIAVEHLEKGSGDVEFEPEDALPEDDRLQIALEMRRMAHRLADTMLAELYLDAAGSPPPGRGGEPAG